MNLLIRTMRNKHGLRQHIVFTDKSGISKPLGVFKNYEIREFIDMYHREQKAMDKAVLAEKT